MDEIMKRLKEIAEEIAALIKDTDIEDSVCIMVAQNGYKDVTAFVGKLYESYTKYSNSDDWEYTKRPREYRYESPVRDCENCTHYKEVPEYGFKACEKWDCQFERIGDSDV